MVSSTNELVLYDVAMSSYAQKVRMALRFKKLPFTSYVPPNLGSGNPDSDFSAANPRLEVPALKDGSFTVFDSVAIMMYLEEKYTNAEHPSLFPPGGDSPEAKAEARMIEDMCGTHYEAINWAYSEVNWFKRAEGAEAERINAAIKEQTAQILEWLAEKLGNKPFFSGDSIGYADMSVAPMLNRSVINKIGPAEGSALKNWHARMWEVPCIKQTWEEVAEAAPKMAAMGPEVWKKGAGRRREYRDHRLEFFIKNGAMDIVKKGIDDDNIRFSWPQPKI